MYKVVEVIFDRKYVDLPINADLNFTLFSRGCSVSPGDDTGNKMNF